MPDAKFRNRRLRVASPCDVPWESMKGDERTRFCQDCRKNVYNLSSLNADEVDQFLAAADLDTCVRFYRRPDGTLLTSDCPVGMRAVAKRMRLRAWSLVAAMLLYLGYTSFVIDDGAGHIQGAIAP